MKVFYIPNDITDNLNKFLSEILISGNLLPKGSTDSMNASQTDNLCQNETINLYLDQILKLLKLDKTFYHRWFHMIDYDTFGSQNPHDHSKTEDYSYIIYLNTCKGGSTWFLSDDKTIEVIPEKNKLILFKSNLFHWSSGVIDNKRVAVGALKYMRDS